MDRCWKNVRCLVALFLLSVFCLFCATMCKNFGDTLYRLPVKVLGHWSYLFCLFCKNNWADVGASSIELCLSSGNKKETTLCITGSKGLFERDTC